MFPPLYAILDLTPGSGSILPLAESLAEAGVRLLQIRAKHCTARQLFEESQRLVARFSAIRDMRIIVNDRPEIARMAEAAGVHVGQDDLPVERAREICGKGLWVGVSTHSLEQLRKADATSADYIAVGPVFPTQTKERPDPVVGVEFLRQARTRTQKPLVAIGGITIESAEQVYRAGADSVAVIRDLSQAADAGRRAGEYLRIAKRVGEARG
ncbi:MAG: thiamine phosphate synthase [Candidatus Acidiferrales bacterium]